jgi:hypothetical protein
VRAPSEVVTRAAGAYNFKERRCYNAFLFIDARKNAGRPVALARSPGISELLPSSAPVITLGSTEGGNVETGSHAEAFTQYCNFKKS